MNINIFSYNADSNSMLIGVGITVTIYVLIYLFLFIKLSFRRVRDVDKINMRIGKIRQSIREEDRLLSELAVFFDELGRKIPTERRKNEEVK
jgi:hypothetical protein